MTNKSALNIRSLVASAMLLCGLFAQDSAAAPVYQQPQGGTFNPSTDRVFTVRNGGGAGNPEVLTSLGSAATQSTGTFLQTANNLSDISSALTARTNLGLGTAAAQDIAAFLQPSNNLSDIGNAAAARVNLGLGTSAILNATGILQPVNNLSDVLSATSALNNILPSQTGNSGKVLGTNGTTTSWVAGGGGGSVSVTAASPTIVINPTPGTGTFTIGTADIINAQGTAASYTVLSSDMGKTVTHAKSSAVAVTLPQAGTTGFESGKSYSEINIGSGAVTITPTTSTINGASTLVLSQNQSAYIISDGTNYVAFLGAGSISTPVSVANGGTGLSSGTSGGIPAFTASGTIASSGVLTANAPVIGGGAGAAPTVGTRSGNTTTFATATGTLTNGHCVSIDASGNFVDAGGACTTGGGGGTVSSGTSGQLAYYAGTGTTVSGLTLGTNLSITGSTLNASGGGTSSAFAVQPSSTYTTDTAGNLFPYVYTGAGGNASAHESGWGVAASLAASPVLEMRFPMPSVLPSGTFKLVSTCLANASSGVMKYTVSDANVASGSNPSSASLTAETQTSITFTAADTYIQTKTTLTSTPTANGTSVVAVTFNATGYTLAAIGMCRFTEIWE